MEASCSVVLNWFVTEKRLKESSFRQQYRDFGLTFGVDLECPPRSTIATDCFRSLADILDVSKAFISVDDDSRVFSENMGKTFRSRISNGLQMASELESIQHPFVLFSCNDDHRFLADDDWIKRALDVLREFYDYEGYLSLPYSHFFEWRLRCLTKWTRACYGLRLIDECDDFWVVESAFPVAETCHIQRTSDLILWYSSAPNSVNAYRNEAVIKYIPFKPHILVVPKKIEAFRHFESSIHAKSLCGDVIDFNVCPPLASDIQIRSINKKLLEKHFKLRIDGDGRVVSAFNYTDSIASQFEARHASCTYGMVKQSLNMFTRQYLPRRLNYR